MVHVVDRGEAGGASFVGDCFQDALIQLFGKVAIQDFAGSEQTRPPANDARPDAQNFGAAARENNPSRGAR